MKALLARWGILTVAVLVATSLVDGFDVHGRVLGHVAPMSHPGGTLGS